MCHQADTGSPGKRKDLVCRDSLWKNLQSELLSAVRNATEAQAGAGHLCGLCPRRREPGGVEAPQ